MNFEEYIKNKKEALDTETPSFHVWNNIQMEVAPQKKKFKVWAIAASLLVILGIGIFYSLQNKKAEPNLVKTTPVKESTTTLPIDTTKPILKELPNNTLAKQDKKTLINTNVMLVKPKDVAKIPTTPKAAKRNNPFEGQGFYDSTLLALKQKIEATPVKWVDQNYFNVYLTEYKNLEKEEAEWKQQKRADITETDFIIHLIQINQQKIEVLANLLKQIKNINTKKGDTTQVNYNKIII